MLESHKNSLWNKLSVEALYPVHDRVHRADEVVHGPLLVHLELAGVSQGFLLDFLVGVVVRFRVVLPEDAHVVFVHLAQGLLPGGEGEEELPLDLRSGVRQFFFKLFDASIGILF